MLEPRVLGVWCLTCLLWSSSFLFIKLGLRDIPPFTFAWLRLLLAAVVLVPLATARGEWATVTPRHLTHVMLAGVVLLGVNYGLIFWGAQYIPSGLVAILQSATPVFALGLGWLRGSEVVTARKVAALACGVVGVALIFGAEAGASGRNALLGSGAVLGSAACVAAAYVWLKGLRSRLRPLGVTAAQCVAGLVPLAIAGFAVEGAPRTSAWSAHAMGALLYLGLVCSVLAFWLNYWLLERMDTSAMLMMGVAEVPIAIALGAAIFDERIPSGTLAGATLILAGVVLILLSRRAASLTRNVTS